MIYRPYYKESIYKRIRTIENFGNDPTLMNIVVIMVEIWIGKPLICLSSQKSLTRR